MRDADVGRVARQVHRQLAGRARGRSRAPAATSGWLLLLVAVLVGGARALRLARTSRSARPASRSRAAVARARAAARGEPQAAPREGRASRTCARVEAIATRDLGLAAARGRARVVVEVEPAHGARAERAWPARPAARDPRTERTELDRQTPRSARRRPRGHAGAPRERMVRLRLMLARALGLALGARDRACASSHLQVLERAVLRAAGRAPERAHDQPRPAPRPDPRPQRPAPRGLRGRREHLRRAPGHRATRRAPPRPWPAPSASTRPARKDLLAQLQKNRAFVWVKRKVDPGTRPARCATCSSTASASSPRTAATTRKRELAAQVLGYVGLDNTGHERDRVRASRTRSSGRAAKVVVQHRRAAPPRGPHRAALHRRAHGGPHPRRGDPARRPSASSSGRWPRRSRMAGVVVVVDPRTGEVLAMANRPTFNPNRFGAYPSARWKNRAVADAYEPGSIFKIVTAAAGAPGEGGRARRDHRLRPRLHRDRRASASTTTRSSTSSPSATAVAKSSDIGMIRVAQRLGPRQLRPLHARLRLRRAHGRRAAGRVVRASCGPPASGARSRSPRSPSARRSASPRCRWPWPRSRGGQRRLPDEAARGAAGRGQRRPTCSKETKPVAVRRVLEPRDGGHAHRHPAAAWCTSGTGRHAAIPGYVGGGQDGHRAEDRRRAAATR